MVEASLRDRRQALLQRPELRGSAFCRAYADEADRWLAGLADRATGGNQRRLALLAVGGYGRASLCPYSDLDVVLIHDGHRDVAAVADAIWYPVWDEGVHLDHSVRRPKEVLAAAAADLRVALGLLDARLVWGDHRVAEPLIEDTVRRWRDGLGAAWLPTLAEQMAERRRAQGDVAFLLEPDLKEAHGGLRDVNVLRAIATHAPLLADYADLASLEPAAAVLTDVRVELHRSANRALERLVLQEQDHIAAALSYPDADALMSAVSEAGRRIAWVGEDAWRRRRLWQPAPAPRRLLGWRQRTARPPADHDADGAARARAEVEPGIVVDDGEVALAPSAPVASDPSLALRLAAVAAERDLPVDRGAVARLAEKAPPPPDPWPEPVRTALVRVLAAGRPAVTSLEALDRGNLLVRLLPEWQAVRHRPQRNAYHRFTVDRHLLEAAANAAGLADRVDRPDLLVIGALLHDIGKGADGDHVAAGVEQVEGIARRMGFAPDDVATLTSLVRHHLLLPDTATRRDLDDPATIDTVARAAGSSSTLALLAALTEADSQATGPSAWGSWKAGLVAELVERTARRLAGGEVPAGAKVAAEHRGALVEAVRRGDEPVVVFEPPRVVVAAWDQRGLLAAVAGTLALHGLDVRSADVTGSDGVAIEIFTVEVTRGEWPDGEQLGADLQAALTGSLPLDEQLAEKARLYAGTRLSSAWPSVPHVEAHNEASATSTVVEVRAPDEPGLLHQVTRALFACDLDVVSARVSTLGSEVVDAFYVRDATGGKVTDPAALDRMHRAVLAAIGSVNRQAAPSS